MSMCQSLYAQSIINIESSSKVVQAEINGEPVRKIYDAKLSSGFISLVCDSAWQFLERNEIKAFGNIQIDTDTENIWTDTLTYFTDMELSKLNGRVIIKQDSTLLFGNQVDYNFITKEAFFRDDVRLEDNQGILTAESGIYYQRLDSAEFRGNVQLSDTGKYAESDSLFTNRNANMVRFYSNVFVADSTNNAILEGDYLEADSTGRRYVEGYAYLRKIEEEKNDTTHIHAHEILMTSQDSVSYINAYKNVEVWSEKFTSLSDTLLYNSETEIFNLISNPKAWHKNIQLTGPFIDVEMDSSRVKQLTAYPQPIAVQEDSLTGRLHQIRGDTLIANFKNNEISDIIIYPDSKVLYHTVNDSNQPDGAIESISPKTILYFEGGELAKVWMEKNQGLFLPEYDGLSERKIEGFIWTPHLKPEKPTKQIEAKLEPISDKRPFELPKRFKAFMDSLD